MGAVTRIGAFNVENMFDRPKAMDPADWQAGRPILAAQARVTELFALDAYDDATKAEILEQLAVLGLVRSDSARFAVLRKLRGRLLTRHQDGTTTVVASGRADWVGWVELVTESVTALSSRHTAMVVRDVHADVLGVVEAESRPVLAGFAESLLTSVGVTPYPQVMLFDGNDTRGIDVGLLTRPPHEVISLVTHVFDAEDGNTVFSRDCAEYHLTSPGPVELVVMVNHFKSKGYSTPGDPQGAKRRERQARRVAEIYANLVADGFTDVAVVGDLNDSPSGGSLAPLLSTDLRDISEHPDFEWGPRRGTHQGGNESAKIDYVLLSPALFDRAVGGGIWRKGVWHGPRARDPWEMYETLTQERDEASDHAAIYADLDWGP